MESSRLFENEHIIDDDSPDEHFAIPDGFGAGLQLENRTTGYGAQPGATAFPDELLIPESEWEFWIKDKEKNKSQLSDIILQAGLPFKNQGPLNYCWDFSLIECVEIVLFGIMGQPYTQLSATKVGALIKKYQNVGGFGSEALAHVIKYGVPPVKYWPEHQLNPKYDTPEMRAAALDYRITEFFEIRPRNKQQHTSCLLRGIPIAAARMRWSHETADIDALWLDGQIAYRGRNQWDVPPYNQNNGFFILRGDWIYADEAVAPRVGTAM